MISSINLVPMADRWVWTLENSGDFSVASIREKIDEQRLHIVCSKTRWVRYVPIKVNALAWKIKIDALPTRQKISRRGIDIQSITCPICDNGVESLDHLFFRCCLARQISRKIATWWNVQYVEVDSYEEWLAWLASFRLAANLKRLIEGVFYVSWWSIWTYRNKLLFDDKAPLKESIFDNIVSNSFHWCSSRHFASEYRKPKENKAFVGGSWSDSEDRDELPNDTTCLMAIDSQEEYDDGHVVFRSNLKGKVVGGSNISHDSITIKNVKHVSGLAFNLICVGQLCDNDCLVSFTKKDYAISKNNKMLAKVHRRNGLYTCKLEDNSKQQICLASVVDNSTLWHRRLGHANMRLVQNLASNELVRNLPKLSFERHFYDTCGLGSQGHSQTSKAYTVLNKETIRIVESHNVTFDESLHETKSSPSVEDERIDEPIV
nr:RNA-directed DNA polymerase, eukaryota [Tanacetum cinerariifolium]